MDEGVHRREPLHTSTRKTREKNPFPTTQQLTGPRPRQRRACPPVVDVVTRKRKEDGDLVRLQGITRVPFVEIDPVGRQKVVLGRMPTGTASPYPGPYRTAHRRNPTFHPREPRGRGGRTRSKPTGQSRYHEGTWKRHRRAAQVGPSQHDWTTPLEANTHTRVAITP